MATSLVEPIVSSNAVAAFAWAADVAERRAELSTRPPFSFGITDLRNVPLVDVRRELDRLLLGKAPDVGLDALLHVGALEAWLPEVSKMVGFSDGEWRHKDVWKHTKQVVKQSVPRLEVRWGSLLHDIGKLKTRSIEPDGKVHFFGHSEVGAAMFRKHIARRLGFQNELYERVHYLILYHLRASQYDGSWTDSAVRRFAREMGDGLTDLLDLSRADITTKRPERRARGLRQISELAARIRKLKEMDARTPPLPSGIGDAIMARFGLPPSRRIGVLKEALEAAVAAGELHGGREAEYYLTWLIDNSPDGDIGRFEPRSGSQSGNG